MDLQDRKPLETSPATLTEAEKTQALDAVHAIQAEHTDTPDEILKA